MTIRRREFITLLGGAAAAWPLAAGAQQAGRMRRIGVLIAGAEDDRFQQANLGAFREVLAKAGWIEGSNLRTDLRWGTGDLDRFLTHAKELASIVPDVIVATSGVAARAVQQATKSIPIVVTGGADPVVAGLVRNIARPEGNITGFPGLEPSIIDKRLALLKEATPHLTRVAVVFNPDLLTIAQAYMDSIEAAALALGVQAIKAPVRSPLEMVRAIDAFATQPNGGLLVVPPPPTAVYRALMVQLAAQHRLPAIHVNRADVVTGGLLAYTSDPIDLYRGAAAYVDRLLRGAKINELPVQFPTKYQLVINLKTAKAIGLTIPEAFLLRADEVIE